MPWGRAGSDSLEGTSVASHASGAMRPHILLAGALCAASPLAAQDTTKMSLTLEVGLVNASGNSEFTSANFGEKATWSKSRWSVRQTAKVLFGETDGTRTTESYDFNLRGERAVSLQVGVYAFAAYQRDPFAGLATRWSGGPGVAWRMVQTGRDTLGLEAAITAQSERTTAAIERTFGAAQTAARFKHSFASAASFTQSLELIANLKTADDYRVNSETALTAPLSSKIGLRISYVIRFDNQPEPTFQKTDRILTTGVQVAL
jgi:putative salt-induced outer membrane protein